MTTPRFTQSATAELYAYWDKRRGARPAPERADIEPADIRGLLPDTFILETGERGGFSWRLAGTRVSALHCRDLKGRDFLTDWRGRDRETIGALLQSVLDDSMVAVLRFDGRTDRGQKLDMEMVLLPLHMFGRSACRVLGAIGFAEAPYWLGIHPPRTREITSMRLLWPPARTAARDMPAAREVPIAPAQRPRRAVPSTPARVTSGGRSYGHLTVFDGGKPSAPRWVTRP